MPKFRINWVSFFRHFVPWFIAPPPPVMPSTRFIATIWKKSHLSDGWENQLGQFDAVSIKAVDRERLHEIESARELAAKVRSAGGTVHAWGFHDCVDWNDAVLEARTAVRAVKDLNASAYHWNAEKEWSESSNPPWFGAVFAREFKKELPDVTLFANCFRSPVDAEMISHFDQYEPMLYGTRPSTIASKFDKEFARSISFGWGRSPGTTCCWMGMTSTLHFLSRSSPSRIGWSPGLVDMSEEAVLGAGMSSDEMLREILRKQEESLDLKGQLVLLNEKMDTLIDTMNMKLSAQGAIAAIFQASPQMPLFLFILSLVGLMLGFGPELVGLINPSE
jgi:hypothetical protein